MLQMPTTRRTFLAGAAGLAAAGALPAAAGNRGLKDHARAKRMDFGCAVRKVDVDQHPGWGDIIRREASILVPEYELKWNALSKQPGAYDFAAADWWVDFTGKAGQKLRGHTLVWHQALPDWFPASLSADEAARLMHTHIGTVAGRYAGKLAAWDVVNEAIDADGLRDSPWLGAIGKAYVGLAFRAAAAADPAARLYYNDYDLEFDTPEQDKRRAVTLDLLKGLRDQGVPIHGLGIEAHLQAGRWPFNPDKFARFLESVAALDLDISITELDVSDRLLPTPVAERDRMVAETARALLHTAFEQSRVVAVLTWGLADWHTWLNEQPDRRRADGTPQRPLPLDAGDKLKPLWSAMARAFDEAGMRPSG